jgi:hypothetical protein
MALLSRNWQLHTQRPHMHFKVHTPKTHASCFSTACRDTETHLLLELLDDDELLLDDDDELLLQMLKH